MGSYYGVRSCGELIAMGGERLQLDGYSEISALCTHPSFRGQGFAVSLSWHLVRNHRRDGLVSWLHVGCAGGSFQRAFLASLCATRAFTSFLMSAVGSGLSMGKWIVPLDLE
jgi:GNAT superfamily N-acetyltransferase